MATGNNNPICRLVDDCPLLEDCKMDGKARPSSCPMKHWSFDELLCEHPTCPECESLSQFETIYGRKMTGQEQRDVSRYWMEHLNRHLGEFEASQRIHRTESRQY